LSAGLPAPLPTTVAGLPGIHTLARGPRRQLTILLAHGVLCDHTFLEPWVAWFGAAGFDTYAVSRRGRQGQPPLHSDGVTFEDFLSDTRRAAGALPHPLLLVGHSLGGILALKAAEQGACEAVALLAPVPPRGIIPLGRIRDLPPQLAQVGSLLSGGTFYPSFRQATAMFMGRIPQPQRRDLYQRYTPDSARAVRTTYIPGVRVDPSRMRVPLLCLVGAEDATIPPKTVARLAQRYGGHFHSLSGHAHELVAEPRWQEVAQVIASWAEGIAPNLAAPEAGGQATARPRA
jgi:pimeloyl-ACP methyl ester carboxylesterase